MPQLLHNYTSNMYGNTMVYLKLSPRIGEHNSQRNFGKQSVTVYRYPGNSQLPSTQKLMAKLNESMQLWSSTSVPTLTINRMTGLPGYLWQNLLPTTMPQKLPVFLPSLLTMDTIPRWTTWTHHIPKLRSVQQGSLYIT